MVLGCYFLEVKQNFIWKVHIIPEKLSATLTWFWLFQHLFRSKDYMVWLYIWLFLYVCIFLLSFIWFKLIYFTLIGKQGFPAWINPSRDKTIMCVERGKQEVIGDLTKDSSQIPPDQELDILPMELWISLQSQSYINYRVMIIFFI